jgi:hypothetical protein
MDRVMADAAVHIQHLSAAFEEMDSAEVRLARSVEAGTPPPLFLAAQRSAEADVRAAFPGT